MQLTANYLRKMTNPKFHENQVTAHQLHTLVELYRQNPTLNCLGLKKLNETVNNDNSDFSESPTTARQKQPNLIGDNLMCMNKRGESPSGHSNDLDFKSGNSSVPRALQALA